jgi:general stress protein CsbA
MIVFGAGEILGSLALGKVIDKLNNRAGVFWVLVVIAVTSTITVYTHSFWWGLSDSTVNTSIGSICGSQFVQEIEAFAIYNFVHWLTSCIFLIFESYIEDTSQFEFQRWYLISVGIFSVLACTISMTIKLKPKAVTEDILKKEVV